MRDLATHEHVAASDRARCFVITWCDAAGRDTSPCNAVTGDSMRAIEQSEEAADTSMGSARLQAISKAIYDCLVSGSGPCESVQGELVRANDRICSEHLRNGMGTTTLTTSPGSSETTTTASWCSCSTP